ncbi:MAG: ABC transporter ATP-binding protein [Alphaproteobacteria bacterium HGW-Alphaproteobacteria-2]|nr:MAG: ABC transporter ATP-binding protein [Alphaproteobacteria bacterium HGW-Alphaproteobacteria-2]
MADAALALDRVSAGYGATHVLEDISLTVPRGERLTIIGRNGAGKTTLLATIMGLTRLHGGRIAASGRDITGMATHRRSALGLGLVPQTRDIFASLSVEENLLAVGRGKAGLEEAYAMFPRLKERRRNGGAQLSGGEQQMLAIARTLMTEPDVLLLDEPLEGLAPVICEQLMRVFEDIARDGRRTVILVEQHVTAALAFATRAVLLANGRVVHDGPAQGLHAQPGLLDRHVGVSLGHRDGG